MPEVTRRGFLSTSATSAGLVAATALGAAHQPNERVILAVMGVRGRGKQLLQTFSTFPDVEIKTICEVDNNVVPAALQALAPAHTRVPQVESDIRRVLTDNQVNAIVVAAPDHWHALATVWACQAGKHVYVEKPCSHNIVEGRRMVEAARRFNKVVQVGTQRRSASHFRSAREFIQSGGLGKVAFARTWIAGKRRSIGHRADGAVPAGVDYNLWLGPAPQRQFNSNRFHYNWHWHWDYGTGELGNNGIHALDMVRGLLDLGAPVRVSAGGGKLFYDDDQQTPDTHIATFDFAETTVIWEHRIWSKTGVENQPWGIALYGQYGTMIFNNGWRVIDGNTASDAAGEMERAHLRNFIDCVKNGQRPNADIEEGHLSTRLCHLGNIALRVHRTLRFHVATESCTGDQEANQLLGRSYRAPFTLPNNL
jgi:predicted dehydrogenase